jgi:anti-anti-sigma factor
MSVTLSPSGDLDELVLDAFGAELAAVRDESELILDFTEVTFCGSACIRLLIETANRLRAANGSLIIRNAPSTVRRAFVVGAVDFLLEPEPDGDDLNATG